MCQRLIQNITILWNELYLSNKIINAETEEARQQIIAMIKNGSTQIWGHLNFLGEYDFTEAVPTENAFDLDKILALQL